ncbi:MAG TPA: efflux RND transporter periplasmic adaptor subunit [Amaricoccus sp.]|uniref:efflux RND transporter periplasmic adaptor subunit n=1 Tax=Amaricoccus sp. TaxID=1872485 RepID=UPI002B5D05CD|nr:efflux RND transporter periplasmic adaptor subunit [Amaricoccus sp.]HMQ93768.1 efflux RND transporter periplasmic adaptor subunit [Amaricoccus sp.]HMR54472.1 efflux RND transporter periplasmic adaptor subunit [Amaricoccus sp.]HMR61040.1 efflux RND transporter periplasmic adaptor subunit [Amaricoccus sp.]HMU01503.1 efflux RND transporter periplasmic adaptor subunit [Amaricoccus sp.]
MRMLAAMAALLAAGAATGGTIELAPTEITEWKAVYGRVEARDSVPARARIGGIVEELTVSEGDAVTAGQRIALVRDDKIAFQVAALDAQMRALESQLSTAETELARGEALVERGVATAQRLDQLRTAVDVARNQLAATKAQRDVVVQQGAEGEVVAPGDGRVLTVPVTRGAVVLAGEPIATIGGGGFFLRLAIPERHADTLEEGATIRITANGAESEGELAKIYPQIENGRVIADVSVESLETAFVNARVLVEVPVGTRAALMVPRDAVAKRSGMDFVTVREGEEEVARAVMLDEGAGEADEVEVLTGLRPGDVVVTP